MEFADKYTSDEKQTKKTILSTDAYAIGEMIDKLIKKIEHVRTSLMK